MYHGVSSKIFTLFRLLSALDKNLIDSDWLTQMDLTRSKIIDAMTRVHHVCLAILRKKKAKKGKRRIAFYTGESGLFALGVQLGMATRNQQLIEDNLKAMIEVFDFIRVNSEHVKYELLYGVPGFLYSVLYAHSFLKSAPSSEYSEKMRHIAETCFDMILAHGQARFKSLEQVKGSRLVYEFHGTEYSGGAHGLSGNLMILLLTLREFPDMIRKSRLNQIIEILDSYEFILSIQKIARPPDWPEQPEDVFLSESALASACSKLKEHSGGFPSRNQRPKRVKKVQFCHGSPGIVPSLLELVSFLSTLSARSSELTLNKAWLTELGKKARLGVTWGLVNIWTQGLLRKGYGLCHGISGNAFSFLLASRSQLAFGKSEHRALLRELAFRFAGAKRVSHVAQQIKEYDHPQRFCVGVSSFPLSLMNGLAGDMCLHLDLSGLDQGFPGFNL